LDYDITSAVMGDLYHLVNPSEEKQIYEVIKEMEEDLKSLETDKPVQSEDDKHFNVPGLRLEILLRKHIDESKDKRTRPGEKKGLFGFG